MAAIQNALLCLHRSELQGAALRIQSEFFYIGSHTNYIPLEGI